MSSTDDADCMNSTESMSTDLDTATWANENDCMSKQQLVVLNGTLNRALNRADLQLATKQRIIDDVTRTLERCMRANSELQVQNEVLQKKLENEQIETQKLKLSSNWYRAELHTVQRTLRGQKEQDVGLSREATEQLKVQLRKALSECAILKERLELERNRRCVHVAEDLAVRYESKDSGIYTETDSSSSELDLSSTCQSKTVDLERNVLDMQHHMELEKETWGAEREMLLKQVQLKTNLLDVHRNSLAQLRSEVCKANETVAAKQKECDAVTSQLVNCRRRAVKLGEENDIIHLESLKMIMKFEEISCLIAEYRREICEKDNQLRIFASWPPAPPPKTMIDQSSQTLAKSTSDKSLQVTANFPVGNYYKNLLAVIEREHRIKLSQREMNIRTLIRQVREQMQVAQVTELRYKELGEAAQLLVQQVLPGAALHSELVQTIREASSKLFIPEESSQSTAMECKLCDSLKASLEKSNQVAADLEVRHRQELKTISEENAKYVAQVLVERESSVKLISNLELERRTLYSSLELIEGKVALLEKQMLEQAQVKCEVESERLRYHQLMVFLIQIKNTRDELLCQNETLNKVLRGLSVVANERNSRSIATKANETLQRCANYKKSSAGLRPLREGISGLRQEIVVLNCSILRKTREVSLLDELQAMEDDQRPFL